MEFYDFELITESNKIITIYLPTQCQAHKPFTYSVSLNLLNKNICPSQKSCKCQMRWQIPEPLVLLLSSFKLNGHWSLEGVCIFLFLSLMPYCLNNLHSVLHICQNTLNPIQFTNSLTPAMFKALKQGCILSPLSWGLCYSGGCYRS